MSPKNYIFWVTFLLGLSLNYKNVMTKVYSLNLKAYSNKIPMYESFYIVGAIEVGNPGVQPILASRRLGFNPQVLFVEIKLSQDPGFHTQNLVWKRVRFVLNGSQNYNQVQVFYNNTQSILIDVEVIE